MPASVQAGPQTALLKHADSASVQVCLGILMALLVLLAYSPALHGGFVWDDDIHISNNPTLRSAAGLYEIWFRPGATCQYYPLTFTAFWLGYQLWGLNTLGYHVLTLSCHIAVALLLWRILARLKMRSAWLAGAMFGLHPVNVMSVAWMTELKNTLSAMLALASALAYLRAVNLGDAPVIGSARRTDARTASDGVGWGWYALALVLFVLAMFAKTAVSFLPVSLLLVTWWQRRRLGWREIWPLLPMIGLVPVFGAMTIHMERLTGATGERFTLGLADRILVSGRSFWFYLGKLVFPYPLMANYERWAVDPRVWWQYLYPAGVVALFAMLWRYRSRLGRGALVAFTHFYVSTSLLIVIVVLYFTTYSFVSDHWQYFGCMSVIALAAAGISRGVDWLLRDKRILKAGCCGLLLFLLGTLTWGQAWVYRDDVAVWSDVLAKNEGSWIGHVIVGKHLYDAGQFEEAMAQYRRAIELNPGEAMPHGNYATALWLSGRFDEAEKEFREAIRLAPDYYLAHANYCDLLIKRGKLDEAQGEVEQLKRLEPDSAVTLYHSGYLLMLRGNGVEAERELSAALEGDPEYGPARLARARLFQQQGRLGEAVADYQAALRLLPGSERARAGLAETLQLMGRPGGAALENSGASPAVPAR